MLLNYQNYDQLESYGDVHKRTVLHWRRIHCYSDTCHLDKQRSIHLLNPITYDILRFRQLRGGGGGGFLARPRKQGYGYQIDFKFATNNWLILVNTQNLKLLAVLLLEI